MLIFITSITSLMIGYVLGVNKYKSTEDKKSIGSKEPITLKCPEKVKYKEETFKPFIIEDLSDLDEILRGESEFSK